MRGLGWIETQRRRIVVRDVEALRRHVACERTAENSALDGVEKLGGSGRFRPPYRSGEEGCDR